MDDHDTFLISNRCGASSDFDDFTWYDPNNHPALCKS